MTQIHQNTNPNALQVFFIKEQIDDVSKQELLKKQDFEAKFGQLCLLPESGQLFVGTVFENPSATIDVFAQADYFNLGAKLANFLKKTKYREIQLNFLVPIEKDLNSLLLGLSQGFYVFDKYKKETENEDVQIYVNQAPIIDWPKLVPNDGILEDNTAYRSVQIVNKAMTLTRNLVNDIPEVINPNTMLGIIENEFRNNANVSILNFDFEKLQEMGMNSIVAVGKGSVKKPIMTHTIIKPQGDVKRKIVLVGKGLTYDSGGLDIKTGGHMKSMKMDMAGSATMFGATKALADIGLQSTELHWISAFAENMLDSNAYKSDDIISSYSGQTIEVFNTDAEGRLTLADVLSYSTMLEPDFIVDAATLTGACIMAVTEHCTAFMTNSEYLKNTLLKKFEDNLEPTIYTPMTERLRKYVKGEDTDLMNTSTLERQAGHVTAGLFLSHFVDQKLFRNPNLHIPSPKCFEWVHLDIAGTAMNNKHNQLETNGATAQSVRSLVDWVLEEDRK